MRDAILGHVQQGGSPSPFDRIYATRLAAAAMTRLLDGLERDDATSEMAGLQHGEVVYTPLAEFPDLVEAGVQRPRREPWWMNLRPLADEMAAAHPRPREVTVASPPRTNGPASHSPSDKRDSCSPTASGTMGVR